MRVWATGINMNANGGHYINGQEYSTLKKVEVEAVYWNLFVELGKAPSKRVLAREARVGSTFAQKVLVEIKKSGGIIPVEQLKETQWRKRDKRVGCICITLDEQAHLLQLRRDEPTRGNDSYIAALFLTSGTMVSSSFISLFFKKVGPFAGNFRKLPTVPVDKFRPANIKTYADYLNFVSVIPPHLLNFGDEKLLKGTEIFHRRGRVDPETGEVEEVVVPPYFRNTFCIMGFVTTNTMKSPPLLYTIGEDNHDSAAFLAFTTNAVATGWLKRGDFIVIDNAVLHSGGACDILEDLLWNAPGLDGEPLRVVVIPFPTRAPELNPIKLNWNTFVLQLRKVKIAVLAQGGGPEVMKQVACSTLDNFTHDDNKKN